MELNTRKTSRPLSSLNQPPINSTNFSDKRQSTARWFSPTGNGSGQNDQHSTTPSSNQTSPQTICWSRDSMTVKQLVECRACFPVIVNVTRGYFGVNALGEQDLAVGQVCNDFECCFNLMNARHYHRYVTKVISVGGGSLPTSSSLPLPSRLFLIFPSLPILPCSPFSTT